ncbi:hypothetical protein [Opitutus sp. GAS368]|uniref:hypothetical protein n=1 Tax=Opitutus sp. GAS368 TaxID=1882749 RepID=UPI00087C0D85|nr:hypothetical protein [Opitutus sp. GAS368]SDS24967.1 4-amino-4-deoxy-L-arabinose transferase [Opitutus sp. GAS368]
MLKSLFQWLDLHPGSYWILVGAASIMLVAWLGCIIGREAPGPADPTSRATWRDALVLFLFLLAWRWPFLLVAYEYNPDESQLIAGAMTLAHDPVFWRSVDGGSSGPLNYYLLVPWHWVGAPLDYFTARLTCVLLTWGALFVCLRALARVFGRTAAWLGLLPAATFFATVTHPELTNLSTENLPLLLIAVVFGLLAGRLPADRFRLWAACFVAGALPWTKLQSAPIGLALISWAWGQELSEPRVATSLRWRRSAEVLLAAALPTLLIAGLAAATGQLEAAWRRYVLQNILYVGTGEVAPVGEALRALWRNAQDDGRFPLLLGTTGVGLLAATAYFLWRRVRLSALLVAGGAITLAAFVAIIAPRREYLHYVLLLPVPLALWFGAGLGGWWRQLPAGRPRLALAGVFLAVGLLPLVTRSLQSGPAPVYGGFVHHWRYPRSSAAMVLHALAGRDDTLGIWGWACHLHVESGLPQATRDGTTLWSIQDNPQQAYHRAAYLADLQRSAPAVFVDAVGQGAFIFLDRAQQAHESWPALADYIRQNYTLVVDLIDARIYARNGLASLRDLNSTRLWQLVGQGRPSAKSALSPPSSTLDKLQQRVIGGRKVVMLLPPAQVEWPLDGEVREVSLEFGFDPEAYERGRSNGAELILEIISPESTHPVFQRFLDPARQPGDRGLQSARVTLPPFTPGSILVLQTDPGPYGDTAWDWVYLASLRLHRESDPGPK